MTFTIPKSKRNDKENQFEFQFPGEKTKYCIPLMQYLRPDLALQLNDLSVQDEVSAFRLIVDDMLPAGTWEKFEDVDQLMAFMNAWKDASGISLGESLDLPE